MERYQKQRHGKARFEGREWAKVTESTFSSELISKHLEEIARSGEAAASAPAASELKAVGGSDSSDDQQLLLVKKNIGEIEMQVFFFQFLYCLVESLD